jgi:hypothetical protein
MSQTTSLLSVPVEQGPVRTKRWRALFVVGLVTANLALVAGLAFAFFTTTGTGTGSGQVGTVALTENGPPATHSCNYTDIVPGDLPGSPTGTCALSVTFTGIGPAWVSLTIAVHSRAGSGGSTLYDGSGTSGLTVSISDGTNSYTVPTGAGTTGGSCPIGFTCWSTANDLAAWYGPGPNLSFTNGKAVTWTVTPQFPTSATNPYQGASATVILSAQAVQALGNPLPAGCTTSTIGIPCPSQGGFSWS